MAQGLEKPHHCLYFYSLTNCALRSSRTLCFTPLICPLPHTSISSLNYRLTDTAKRSLLNICILTDEWLPYTKHVCFFLLFHLRIQMVQSENWTAWNILTDASCLLPRTTMGAQAFHTDACQWQNNHLLRYMSMSAVHSAEESHIHTQQCCSSGKQLDEE